MKSPHGPKDQDKSHPRANVAWPPLTDISGTHTPCSFRPGRREEAENRPASIGCLSNIGAQRCGSAALSDPTALGADQPSCNLKPCDCQLNGSVLGVGGFQEELTCCSWRNGCGHVWGTYACAKYGWCLLFRIASWSSLNLFVLGARIIIICL